MRRFFGALVLVLTTTVVALAVNLATNTISLPSWLDEPGILIVLGLLVIASALVEWRRGRPEPQLPPAEQLVAATDFLAQATLSLWSAQSETWGITTTTDPVRVTWQWDHERSLPIHEVFGGAGGKDRRTPRGRKSSRQSRPTNHPGGRGVVTDLHPGLYRRLQQQQQLVLLGPAGSGKSAAMLMLLVKAAQECADPIRTGGHARTPVPVWITLGGWNPDESTLRDHVVREMETTFRALRHPQYGAHAARRLIEQQRVALFLDGLDEMPQTGRRAALQGIAREASGLRVVLTSQVDGYDHARGGGRLPRPVVLQLDPVKPDTAAEYLRRGHDTEPQRRFWQRITDDLRSRPDSPIAEAFATPLTLSLARDAFAAPAGAASDPEKLLGLSSVAEVRSHVIGQFLERAYPCGPGAGGKRERRRNRRHLSYLAWIAHQLRGHRDLRWWEIPTWVPEMPLMLAVGVGFGLLTAVLTGAYAAFTQETGWDLWWTLLGAFLAGACFARPSLIADPPGPTPAPAEPIGMDLRWPTRAEMRTLVVAGSGIPLPVGVSTGLLLGPLTGVLAGMTMMLLLVVGTSIGRANVTAGLLGIWLKPLADSPASTPESTWRADRRRTLVMISSSVVLWGVLFTLIHVVDSARPGTWPVKPEVGIILGMLYGVFSGLGPAVLTGFTPVALLLLGHPPVRFPVLLRESLRRQVLRQSGMVYQFRHAELQDHLAAVNWRRQDTDGM